MQQYKHVVLVSLSEDFFNKQIYNKLLKIIFEEFVLKFELENFKRICNAN